VCVCVVGSDRPHVASGDVLRGRLVPALHDNGNGSIRWPIGSVDELSLDAFVLDPRVLRGLCVMESDELYGAPVRPGSAIQNQEVGQPVGVEVERDGFVPRTFGCLGYGDP